jgi:hypothetical protein
VNADEYAAAFKARKAAQRKAIRERVLAGVVTPGERQILAQERAEREMGE